MAHAATILNTSKLLAQSSDISNNECILHLTVSARNYVLTT